MLDEERFRRLAHDARHQPALVATLVIRSHADGTMSLEAPFGDKQLCLTMLDQAREQVLLHGKDRGWVLVPPGHTDAAARLDGYA